MLRFPKLHKGWVPKNTRNDLISLFWLNRSDLWLEYKKRDIEVKMDFGDIPYENLKDKGWDYVNKKLKEIDELEQYRKMEKQAYILPMKTLETDKKSLEGYYLKTEHLDLQYFNQRAKKCQTLMTEKGVIFQEKQKEQISLDQLTPVPQKYLELQQNYENALIYFIRNNKTLQKNEILFLENAQTIKNLSNNDIFLLAQNKYFKDELMEFQRFFSQVCIQDQNLFKQAIQNFQQVTQESQFCYVLTLFKNNKIDTNLRNLLLKVYKNDKQENVFLKRLTILKVFEQNNKSLPIDIIDFDVFLQNFIVDQKKDKQQNQYMNLQIMQNPIQKSYILDRLSDNNNLIQAQKNLFLNLQILHQLNKNEDFSFYLYLIDKIFGKNYLKNTVVKNLKRVVQFQDISKNIETLDKSIQNYEYYSQYSEKPKNWFQNVFFISDNKEIQICDRLQFEDNSEVNKIRQKINFYEQKKFQRQQKIFDLQQEYKFIFDDKQFLQDENFDKTNENDNKIKNIEQKYRQEFYKFDYSNDQLKNIKGAQAFASLKTILKSQKYFFSSKFDQLRNRMREQLKSQIVEQQKKDFSNHETKAEFLTQYLKSLSQIKEIQQVDDIWQKIVEFKEQANVQSATILREMLNFNNYDDGKIYFTNVKHILQKNRLPNQKKFFVTYKNVYGKQNINLNKYLINEFFYQQEDTEFELEKLIVETLSYQLKFLAPTYLSMLLFNDKPKQGQIEELTKDMSIYDQTEYLIFLAQYCINNKLQLLPQTFTIILNHLGKLKYYKEDYAQIYLQFIKNFEVEPQKKIFQRYLKNLNQYDFEKQYFEFNKVLKKLISQDEIKYINIYNKTTDDFFEQAYEKDYINVCKKIVMNRIKLKLINTMSYMQIYKILAKDMSFIEAVSESLTTEFSEFFQQNMPFENEYQIQEFIDLTQKIIEDQASPLKLYQKQFTYEAFNILSYHFNEEHTDKIIDSMIKTNDINLCIQLLAFMKLDWSNCTQKQYKFGTFLIKNAKEQPAKDLLQKKINNQALQIDRDDKYNLPEKELEFEKNNQLQQDQKDQDYIVEETGLPFRVMSYITQEEIRGTRLELNIRYPKFPKLGKRINVKNPYKFDKMNMINKYHAFSVNWAKQYNQLRDEQLDDQEKLQEELKNLRERPYLSKYLLDEMDKGKSWRDIYPEEEDDELVHRRYVPVEMQSHFQEYIYECNQDEEEDD